MYENTLPAVSVPIEELGQVKRLVEDLPQGSVLAAVLQNIVNAAQRGVDISLFTSDEALTPNQAADLLQMSRAHLVKLMDNNAIAFHRVGTHRRIHMGDLVDFIGRQERANAFVAHAVGTVEHSKKAVMNAVAEYTDAELAELRSGS